MSEKVLHLINWTWNNVADNMDKIKASGFTCVQVSPCQPCKKLWNNDGQIKEFSNEWYNELYKTWWKLYQITDFTIGNYLGSKYEYINMCNVAHKYGIKVIQDVILRHVADDEEDNTKPYEEVNKDLVQYIKADQTKVNNYNDRIQVISKSTDCLLLDYENVDLQNKHIIPFLQEVLQYADGLRLDECKHFGLPTEGYNFFTNVFSQLPTNKFYYGECLQVNENELRQYSKYLLPLLPFGEGWNIRKGCVSFMESNDTCNSFMYTMHMTDYQRLEGYEGVLREYGNAIYYARRDDNTIFSNEMKRINSQYK